MHRSRHSGKFLALVISIVFIALPLAAAPPEGKVKGNPQNQQKQGKAVKKDHAPAAKNDNKRDRDRDHDRDTANALISAAIGFDAARRIALDNKYTGYSRLPPGIRKNLARGKPIPPGIAKKTVPGPMLARLPRHDGYEWRIYGSDLVLVATATAVIADVLFDVFD